MGNTITEEAELNGVFKLRTGEETSNNMELRNSTATLHVHPEDFEEPYTYLVGQGVRKDCVDYEITSVTGGLNFVTGIIEHLTLTLNIADYAEGE